MQIDDALNNIEHHDDNLVFYEMDWRKWWACIMKWNARNVRDERSLAREYYLRWSWNSDGVILGTWKSGKRHVTGIPEVVAPPTTLCIMGVMWPIPRWWEIDGMELDLLVGQLQSSSPYQGYTCHVTWHTDTTLYIWYEMIVSHVTWHGLEIDGH